MSTLTADKQGSSGGPDVSSERSSEQRTSSLPWQHATQLTIVLACVAAVVLIVLIALNTSPIADDYGDLAQIGHGTALGYLESFWLNLTDRYGDAVFMVALIRPFGMAAIHIATLLLFTLLSGFCTVAAGLMRGPGHSRRQATVVGTVAAVAIATTTPSLFDTLGWFNAVAIYLTGVVAAAGTGVWMAWLATRKRRLRVFQIAASFVVGFAAAGFTELIGMVIASGSLLAVANARAIADPGPRRRALIRAYLATACGATTGVALILFGPGSRARFRYQHGGFDLSRTFAAIRDNMPWVTTLRWDGLACAAAGLLVFGLHPRLVSRRNARWLIVWCAFLICVPLLAVDASTSYAGGEVAAPRTAYVATACIGAGVALFAYMLAAALVETRPRSLRLVRPSAALAFAVWVVFGFGSAAVAVIKAEQLRQTVLSTRGASVRRQLAVHRRTVWLMPAPLLILDTSAFDLEFRHRQQYIWVLDALRQYYDIPAKTALRAIPTQARGYCLNGVTVPWAGVESCQQLRKD